MEWIVGKEENVHKCIGPLHFYCKFTLLGSYKCIYNTFFNILNSSLGKSLGDVISQLIQDVYFTFSGSDRGGHFTRNLDLVSGDSLENQGYDVAEEVYTEEQRHVPQLRTQEVIGEIKLSGFFER